MVIIQPVQDHGKVATAIRQSQGMMSFKKLTAIPPQYKGLRRAFDDPRCSRYLGRL